jgi:catechol 2,3-dioxygenase-like lactoylglutathione lyase family enzyme
VIVYVPDVPAAVELYERAFGMARTFIDPSGRFGQLDTGTTALAFAAESLADEHLPAGVRRPGPDEPPANVELALVFEDVAAAFRHAVAEGCTPLAEPAPQPQGQTVGWVRDPFGTLIEIASPLEVS